MRRCSCGGGWGVEGGADCGGIGRTIVGCCCGGPSGGRWGPRSCGCGGGVDGGVACGGIGRTIVGCCGGGPLGPGGGPTSRRCSCCGGGVTAGAVAGGGISRGVATGGVVAGDVVTGGVGRGVCTAGPPGDPLGGRGAPFGCGVGEDFGGSAGATVAPCAARGGVGPRRPCSSLRSACGCGTRATGCTTVCVGCTVACSGLGAPGRCWPRWYRCPVRLRSCGRTCTAPATPCVLARTRGCTWKVCTGRRAAAATIPGAIPGLTAKRPRCSRCSSRTVRLTMTVRWKMTTERCGGRKYVRTRGATR